MPVELTRDGVVATLTLNRPSVKNALDRDMWTGLREGLAEVAQDNEVRALLVTGAGGDFRAGADLSGGPDGRHPLVHMEWIGQIAASLHELPKPSIAKVDGVAVGAGWNLALGGDFVVATPAARFGQVTWIKPGEEIDAFVAEQAAELGALPPVAVAQSKRLLHQGAHATEDAPAAVRAFLTRTTAVYTGQWAVK